MSMILPKGIIVNSPHIEGSIEQLDAQPVGEAELARLWKVYTTTQRRLRDPTAERLENLWWRIWGSRSRKLRGAVVARLFAQISDGETFVPLRGPPNRDEGPSLNTQRRIGPGASSTTALQTQRNLEKRHEAQRQQEQNKSGTDKSGTENSPSSRSQAPMPHPILKKTRGPSNSGPRPTARFISPHDTEDEASPVTSESTNSHVVVEPPSPMDPQDPQAEKKSSIAAGKKKAGFVASKKRRPVIVKRQSSQSSTESAARNAESAQFSAIQSSAERTPPTFAAQSRARQSRFQEKFSPSSGQSLSNVQSPKRRVVSRPNSNKHVSPRKPASGSRKPKVPSDGADQTASAGGPGPSTTHHRKENQIETLVDPETLTEEELHELELQRTLLEEANARVDRQNQRAAQLLEQAQAEAAAAAKQVRQTSHGSSAALNLLSHDSKSKSTSTVGITPTLVAPSGELALGAFGDCASDGLHMSSRSASMGRLDKGKGRDPEELRRTAMFAKRTVQPVYESAAASPDSSSTLSRSKSQLTLLLEKDRKRGGNSTDKSSKSPRDKGKGRA